LHPHKKPPPQCTDQGGENNKKSSRQKQIRTRKNLYQLRWLKLAASEQEHKNCSNNPEPEYAYQKPFHSVRFLLDPEFCTRLASMSSGQICFHFSVGWSCWLCDQIFLPF
jgi:hypothetical protein